MNDKKRKKITDKKLWFLTYEGKGKPKKSWQIEPKGKAYIMYDGFFGTVGKETRKEFNSAKECLQEAQKLLDEKFRQGYVEYIEYTENISKKKKNKKQSVKDIKKNGMEYIKKIEKMFDIKIPDRYKIFLTTGEYDGYNKKVIGKMPNYGKSEYFMTNFADFIFLKNVKSMVEDEEVDLEKKYIPLSPLYLVDRDMLEDLENPDDIFEMAEEIQFLAIDISNPGCKVCMWEHEDGKFYSHSPSLDKFLKQLIDIKNL